MAKGENIFKRKDGRWEARYIKGYELSGKIKYGFCYGKTYKEAKEKVTKAKAALLSGKPIPASNSRHRFSWFCDEWFESGRNRFKESTCVKYRTILDKHIKPRLGGCFPLGMSDALIEQFANELLFEEELAPKTVKDILVVVRSILDYTAKRFPGTFPTLNINYPKESKKEMRVLSREEQTRFSRFLLDDMDACKFGVLLALLTGIRIGDDDDKIRLNQRKPSKYKGLRRFGPEKNLQRINKFMKERPIFYKNLIQMKENIRFYLRCFYCITKVMILQFNSENRTELARNG